MALSITTITLIDGTVRDGQATSFKTLIDAGTAQTLVLLNRSSPGGSSGGTGVLVTLTLDATAAFTGPSGGNGLLTLDVSPAISAVASAGAADTVNTWELRADATVLMRGIVTGSDTITSGQTVNITSLTLTWPAS